jgi:arylsulfatase A-like enzyme
MVDSYNNGSIPLKEVQAQIDLIRDRYDEFIMYCDNQFKDFIKRLEAANVPEKTIVILSSSHGSIFTPAYLGTGGSPREAVTHIPLIIKGYGHNKQNIIDDIVEQIDIPPTILELAHIEQPSWMEGRSLAPLMNGKKLIKQPAFSVDLRFNPSGEMISQGIVAVHEGDYKLIYDLSKKTSGLFNIRNDPDEQDNLMDKEPAIGKHLLSLIKDKINEVNQAFNNKQRIR